MMLFSHCWLFQDMKLLPNIMYVFCLNIHALCACCHTHTFFSRSNVTIRHSSFLEESKGGCPMVAAAALQRHGRRHEFCDGPHVLQAVVFACVVATHSRRAIHEAEPFPSHREVDLHVNCFQQAKPGAGMHTKCLIRMDVAPSADRMGKI